MDKLFAFSSWSFSKKLLLLLVIVFLTASGVIVFLGFQHRSDALREAGMKASLLIQCLTLQQEQLTATTRQMLVTLSGLPEVKRKDAAACNDLFRELKERQPFFTFLGAATPEGKIFAGSAPLDHDSNISDRDYMRNVLRTYDFSAGDYIVGRISGEQSLSFAYPVFNQEGLVAVVMAGLRLEEFANFLEKANVPADSSIAIIDRKGTQLFRFPETERTGIGRPVRQDVFSQISGDAEEGTFETFGDDGVAQIHYFKQLKLKDSTSPYLYFCVDVAKEEVYQSANRYSLIYLSILVIPNIFVAILLWALSHRLIIRPVNKLVASTQALGKGDMETRTGLPHSSNEVGRLAKAFDDMASLLEKRQIQREEADEALFASEQKFRLLVENAPDAIYLQTDGIFTYLNPAALDLFGAFSDRELLGKHHLERVHPDYCADFVIRMRRLEQDKNPVPNFECKFIRLDGTVVDVETSAVPSEYKGHSGALCFVRDISARMKAQGEAEHFNLLNRLILDTVSEGIIGIDAEARGFFANPSAVEILGYTEEELIGVDLHDLIHHTKPDGSPFPRSECLTCKTLKTGETSVRDDFFWRKDGKAIPVRISCTPMMQNGATIGVVMTFQDLSALKNEEETKTMLEAKLAQAQKLEAIGTLAGGIAHDFNNILSPIIGYSEMGLQDVTDSNSVIKTALEQVLKAGLRARDLVKQILMFSRPDRETQRGPIDLSISIKEVLKLLRASLPATIEIKQDLKPCWAVADPTQIHQVLMNLCVNAVHAMDGMGTLGISLNRVVLTAEELGSSSIIGLSPGPFVQMTVSDSGCGMDENTLRRIFEPYFTTKDSGKGTGLGLSVVHGIVKKHEGAVSVWSAPGKGTTFTIYFPEVRMESDSPFKIPNRLAGGKERILLVDDEPIMVELGALILERLGYQVTSQTDSELALEIFGADGAGFDLVITDFTMPKLTGIELAKEVLRIRPKTPVILCTGFAEKTEHLEDLGVAHIMKPFVAKDLAELIRKVLEKNN